MTAIKEAEFKVDVRKNIFMILWKNVTSFENRTFIIKTRQKTVEYKKLETHIKTVFPPYY